MRRLSSTSEPPTASLHSYTFFTDRDLGHEVPRQLGEAGFAVERHDHHFPPGTTDAEWYPRVGREGWIALTHDKGQWRKSDERDAAMRAGVALFIVVGRMRHDELGEFLVRMAPRLVAFRAANEPPFIAKVYRRDARHPTHTRVAGRIELLMNRREWERGRR